VKVGCKRVARLMKAAGLQGVTRRKWVTTTQREPSARPAPDLLARDFTASGPDQRWVADIERHEALLHRAVMKGHRLPAVAAAG
jgi:transposase InsO family protein